MAIYTYCVYYVGVQCCSAILRLLSDHFDFYSRHESKFSVAHLHCRIKLCRTALRSAEKDAAYKNLEDEAEKVPNYLSISVAPKGRREYLPVYCCKLFVLLFYICLK